MTNDGRRDPRQPLAFKIRFKSATLNDFVEKHSRDLSRGGFFIKTPTPLPVGTLIKFDVRLEDEQSLIQGVGRVVWRRETAREDAPAGMGIKFIKLDTTSRENLDTLLEERSESGPPGEAPTVEEQMGLPSRPPYPIKPVHPSSIPLVKNTMKGMPVPAESSTSTVPNETSGHVEDSAQSDSLAPQDFIAEIEQALADGSLDFSGTKPEEEASEPDADDEPSKKTEDPAEPTEDKNEGERVIVDSSLSPREDETPTGLQPMDPVMVSATVDDDWDGPESEYEKTIARPLLSEDIARKAEELETKDKPAPAIPPKAERAKPIEAPKPPPKQTPDSKTAAASSSATSQTAPASPEKPTLRPPQPAQKSGSSAVAIIGVALIVVAGLMFWYIFQELEPAPPVAMPEPESLVGSQPEPKDTTPIDTTPAKSVSFGLADVSSSPEGASIYLGKEAKGKTPLTLEGLDSGVEVEVTAKLFGYKTTTVKVTPSEESAKTTIKLEPAVVEVIIESEPSEARVFLAGDWIGKTPRTTKLKGKGPQLEYKLQRAGYEELSGAIGETDWTEKDGTFTATVKATLTKLPSSEPAVKEATTKASSAQPTQDRKPTAEKPTQTDKKPIKEEPVLSAEPKKPAPEPKKPAPEPKKPAPEPKKPAPEPKKPAPEPKKPPLDENPF